MRSDLTRSVKEMAEDRYTIKQISAELNLSYEQVRYRLNRAGVRPVHEHELSLREKVQDMKAIDAVEFLLNVIEQMDDVQSERVDNLDIGFHLTESERRIFSALVAATPGFVSKDSLYTSVYFDRNPADDLPEPKIIDVYICKLRARLPESVGHIETIWGKGYRFVPAVAE